PTIGASLMINGSGLEGTFDITTVICTGPPCSGPVSSVSSDAGTTAVSCVLLTNVVAKSMLFQSTTAPGAKLEPLTVSVNVGPPSTAEPVLRVARAGGGPVSPIGTSRDSSISKKGWNVRRAYGRRGTAREP